ncbi:MAG: immunity 8 family protein [Pseudomonadota bacterium]
MNAELKRLHSPDIYDLENYQPEHPRKFGFLLQAMVGPKGKEGEESFDLEVCTPGWLEEAYGPDEVIIGQHYLIVREYNYQRIVASIENFLRDCSGKNWREVGEKVSRLGKWEFEDYIE